MPPKKDNKAQNNQADNTGIPKNDVIFKISFSVQTSGEQLPQCVVLYQWFSGNDKFDKYDAGLVESWTKKESQLTFQKSLDSIRVEDQFCKNISSHKFFIYFINPQTSIVQDQLLLDYSSLLMFKTQPSFQFKSNTIKIHNIDSFTMKITADKQLLQQMYRQYLNPMQVQVIGALDIPFDSTSKYLPTYIKYKFYDGTVVETNAMVGQDKILWQHKHVFLMGLMNANQAKEKIRSNYLKFQFHDKDQVQNNKLKQDIQLFDIAKAIAEQMEKQNPVQQDPKKKGATSKKQPEKKQAKKQTKKDTKKKDAKIAEPILPKPIDTFKNNYGVAVFSLVQFLKPAVRTAKYKSPVIPRTLFQDFQSRNIDLNTTARNQMQKIVFSNNYFDRDTTIVVGFTLSYPIGSFVQKYVQKVKQQSSVQSTPIVIDQNLKKQLNNYQRVVIFLPYKDKQSIRKLEDIFYQVNLKAFNLKNKREITTHLLKKQQKQSTVIDYLSGLQIIDPEGRVYIIQGLKGKSITKIYQALPKQIYNKQKQKILKNTKILFTTRIYNQFNIQLKRIRLRPSLSQILLDPSIYIKSKVDQKICQNLNKLSDLRKICDDLQTVENMNLWPNAEILVQIQRKYSQSLNYEDINGQKQQKRAKASGLSQTKQIKSIDFLQKQGNKFRTAEQFFNTKTQQPLNDTLLNQTNDLNTSTKRLVHTKTFIRDNPKTQTYNFHLTSMPPNPNQPVYIYASQKLNWYQKQNQLLREKIQADKNKMYTMSMNYLGLSVDPHTLEGQRKREDQLNKTKQYSKDKFSSLLIRTKQQKQQLAKRPNQQDISNMLKYPYHQQKQRQIQIKKSQRDKPVTNVKEDFKKYIKTKAVFSQPQVLQIQKMARVQQQRILKQQKLKREQQQRKKLLGDSYMKTKKGYCSDKVTDLDKFTNILQGSPSKLGLIDLHKKSKQKRPVENYQVSLYLKQKINNPAFNPLVRTDDESKNVGGYQFNNYQKPQVLTQTGIYKPLKQI